MIKRYGLLISLLISLVLTPFLLQAKADYEVKRSSITVEDSYQINLDSRDANNNMQTINLNDFNYDPPAECQKSDTVCFESSVIDVNVKKTWEIATLFPITDARLERDVFSVGYPEITADDWETLRDNPEEIMLAQRTLYERGLMEVLPTGQYGYLTEAAIIKLQALKAIQEVDYDKGQVIIGPQTIDALNALKSRLKQPDYLGDHPLPTDYAEVMPPLYTRRLDEIDTQLKEYEPTVEQKQAVEQNQTEAGVNFGDTNKPDGSQLKFYGEAVIQK